MPPPPKFAWTQAPASHRHVSKVIQDCNWLQALEGGLDTSHAPILHRLTTEHSTRGGIAFKSPFVQGRAPRLVIDLTDYGYQYAGIRSLGDSEQHIRSYHFVLPFHQIRPYRSVTGLESDAGHIWVPNDDETCTVYNWHYSVEAAPLTDEDRLERGNGNGPSHVDPNTFRSKANRQNNYLMDREIRPQLIELARLKTTWSYSQLNTQLGLGFDFSLVHFYGLKVYPIHYRQRSISGDPVAFAGQHTLFLARMENFPAQHRASPMHNIQRAAQSCPFLAPARTPRAEKPWQAPVNQGSSSPASPRRP